MKKLLSLLLAGLMVITMAGSVLAGGIADSTPSNQLIYETIYGENWYYWYLLGWLDPLDRPTLPGKDTVDPDMSVTPDKMIATDQTAVCPYTGCAKVCQLWFSTSDGITYKAYTYCHDHGLLQITDTAVKPGTAATYTVSAYSTTGGSVYLNGEIMFGSKTVKKGENVTVSIVPQYGYDIEGVYLNGYYIGKTEGFMLEDIRTNYSIKVVFRRVDITRTYTIKTTSIGDGSIHAAVNGKNLGAVSSVIGTYADKATLRFVPAGKNYYVQNVTINGVNMGQITSYDISRFSTDLDIVANFVWDCPYTDVAKEYMDAVEYVTEIDVMGSPNLHFDTDKFMGKNTVSVRSMACYLAELADVNDKLNSVADRIAWATEKGLIGDKEDLSVSTTWTRACDMLAVYVRNLEKDGNVVFKDLVNAESAYAIAKSMDLVTEASYKADGKICRYDMAEICYAIALLETK